MGSLYCDRVYGEHPIGLWSFSEKLGYISLLQPFDSNNEYNSDLTTWKDSNTNSYPGYHEAKTSLFLSFIGENIPSFPGNGDTYKTSGIVNQYYDKTYDEFGTEISAESIYYIELRKNAVIDPSEFSDKSDRFEVGLYVYHDSPVGFFEILPVYDNGDPLFLGIAEVPKFDDDYENPTIINVPQYVASYRASTKEGEWSQIVASFPKPVLRNGEMEVPRFGLRIRAYLPNSEVDGEEAGQVCDFLAGGISVGQMSGSLLLAESGRRSVAVGTETGLRHFDIDDVVEIPEYGFGRDMAYVTMKENSMLAKNRGIPMTYGDRSSTFLYPGDETPSIIIPGKGFLHSNGKGRELSIEFWMRVKNSNHIEQRLFGPIASNDGLFITDNVISLVVGNQHIAYDMKDTFYPMLVHIGVNGKSASLMVNGDIIGQIPISSSLPDSYNYNNDWLGFYMSSELDIFEISSVSIFPYLVSPLIAKRRYVWAQGVVTLGRGDSAIFKMDSAKYTYSMNIPLDTGYSENLESVSPIMAKKYELLPTMNFNNEEWYGDESIRFTDVGQKITVSNVSEYVSSPKGFFIRLMIDELPEQTKIANVVLPSGSVSLEAKVNGQSIFVREVITDSLNNTSYSSWEQLGSSGSYDWATDISNVGNKITSISIGGFIGDVYKFGVSDSKTFSQSIDENYIGLYTVVPVERFGRPRIDIITPAYWRSEVPLSALSYIYSDAGGRSASNLDFFQINTGTENASFKTYLSFRRIKDKSARVLSDIDTVVPLNDNYFVDISNKNVAYEVKNCTVLVNKFKDPHMYIMEIHIAITGTLLCPSSLNKVSLESVAHNNDTFHQIGTSGTISAYPYSKYGAYYVNKVSTPYQIGDVNGSVMHLSSHSGITVNDGSISIFGRAWPTLLGIQFWIKADGNEGKISININGRSANLHVQESDKYSYLGLGDSDIMSSFTLYQDGLQVDIPVLYKDCWTSIGVSLDTPVETGGSLPEIVISGCGTINNVAMYGGSTVDRQLSFRNWKQVSILNGEIFDWGDWENKTWQEVLVSSKDIQPLSIGKLYLGTVGANRYVVGEDEGDEEKAVHVINGGTVTISKEIEDTAPDLRTELSSPSWRTIGQYK